MAEAYTDRPVHYCYQCGNRVSKNLAFCWYCSAPVERSLRPIRRCSFCAEVVRSEAVKCRHCGEFLDGRPREDLGPTRQVIVIDKNLLQAMSDLRLIPGSPVPDLARRVLDAKTVEAIEHNEPERIEQPGVRVLPAPEDAEPEPESNPRVIEAKAREVKALPGPEAPAPLARKDVGGRRNPLVRAVEQSSALAKREEPKAELARPRAEKGWLAKSKGKPAGEADAAIDAEIAEEYRTCIKCRTEILTADSFCYYCGQKYRETPTDAFRRSKARRQAVGKLVKFVVLILFGTAVAIGTFIYFSGRSFTKQDIEKAKEKLIDAKDKVMEEVEKRAE